MGFKKFATDFGKRILKHWQTTVKGIIYGILTFMYWEGKIDTMEWIAAVGSILTLNSIFFQKDPDKVMNKPTPEPDEL